MKNYKNSKKALLLANLVLGLSLPLLTLAKDLDDMVLSAANALGKIAVVVIAMMAIVSAIMWATSAGDPQKAGNAKKALVYTIIGAVVLALSWSIYGIIRGWVTTP